MRFVVGTDDARPIVDQICNVLTGRGHSVDRVAVGAWGAVAVAVGRVVADDNADFGVICCWTGTGVCMAANKVRGIRAALCVDAATAAGARQWNNANVLALSLRLLSEPIANEILDAWLNTPYGGTENDSLKWLAALE